MQLPPFPTDDTTLDLLWAAMFPDPEVAEQSSLGNLLDMMSQLGGADTTAVEQTVDDGSDGGPQTATMRDPHYHCHDVIAALITEVRRLRAAASVG